MNITTNNVKIVSENDLNTPSICQNSISICQNSVRESITNVKIVLGNIKKKSYLCNIEIK